MNISRFTSDLNDLDTFHYFNDFPNFTTATDGVSSLAADIGATVAAGSTRSGVAVLTTGATDNNEAAVFTTNALFTLLANKPIYARGKLQYSEAATNAANVAFGFASSFGADLLVDNGGGVRTTGTSILIYKIDGGTVWRCSSRNGSNVTDTVSTTTAGGSAQSDFEIEIGDWDGVSMQCTYKVDGAYLKDSNGITIKHTILISGATIASVGAYVKAGSGSSEVLNVDVIYGAQLR